MMEEYFGFFKPFSARIKSLADWIKALWLIVRRPSYWLLTALLDARETPVPEVVASWGPIPCTANAGRAIPASLRHTSPDDKPALLPLGRRNSPP